jgi:Meckelin (Transmembrane protein 67)
MQANSTINFTIVSYGLQGNEVEMRPLTLGDLNLCNQFSSPVNLWHSNVIFAENFFAKCSINLRQLIEHQPDMDTKFLSIYLSYYENQAKFLQTVPILVRNAFEVNKVRFCAMLKS